MSTVPNSIIAAHARAARTRGVNVEALLHRFDLDPDAIFKEQGRSEIQAFGQWLGSLWHEMGDESGGFCRQPMKIGTFAMANYAVASAGTLRKALIRSGQFYDIVGDCLRVSLHEEGQEARVVFQLREPSDLDRRVFYDSLLIIWLRWSSWLVDTPLLPERVHLSFDWPPYRDEYEAMYGCPVYARQPECALIIDRAYLDLPVNRTPEQMAEFLAQAPSVLLTQYRRDRSLAQRVRRILNASRDPLMLDQGHVAERLSVSPATLRRHLHSEGTRFQALKDQWRRGRAVHFLKTTDWPLQRIALELGFSEASAFHRAFKRWTRINPGDYRDNNVVE